MLRLQIFEVNGLCSGNATPQRLGPLGDLRPPRWLASLASPSVFGPGA